MGVELHLLLIFHLDMASKSNSKRLRWMTSVCGSTFRQLRLTASTCSGEISVSVEGVAALSCLVQYTGYLSQMGSLKTQPSLTVYEVF